MASNIQIKSYQVDAFTNTPFRGNPAAVCLLQAPIPTPVMQAVAAEMNLSETAFVQPPDPGGIRRLRWFTPTVEVPLCGHATLATAHVLLKEEGAKAPLRFDTLSGVLTVDTDDDGWLRMDFPSDPPDPARAPEGLLEALGCPSDALVFKAVKAYVVRLKSQGDVLTVTPDMPALRRVDLGPTALGVIVTAPGSGSVDFVSRFFGPWVGVDEDPVTGMAHTILGPYWNRETGREVLWGSQLSDRGGHLRVRFAGERVHVSGQAVTVMEGSLTVPAEA